MNLSDQRSTTYGTHPITRYAKIFYNALTSKTSNDANTKEEKYIFLLN
jgi:hypothetical protein